MMITTFDSDDQEILESLQVDIVELRATKEELDFSIKMSNNEVLSLDMLVKEEQVRQAELNNSIMAANMTIEDYGLSLQEVFS